MKKKVNIKILLIGSALLFFAIPSSFAIFKSYASSSGSLSSAVWNVSLNSTGENNYLTIVPEPENVNDTYTLHMTNNSEVDVIYSIIIDNVPSGVSAKAGSGNFVSESNNKILINNAGVIHYAVGDNTEDCVLTFKAASNATFVDEQPVSISVILSQEVPS